ncbi:MAG: hypothetical protein J6J87_06340, partial [Oscillospiraceae bacterium]|nr:hypothetical protein [Oscillospiraceae bacterium]
FHRHTPAMNKTFVHFIKTYRLFCFSKKDICASLQYSCGKEEALSLLEKSGGRVRDAVPQP